MKIYTLVLSICMLQSINVCSQTITDIDGNIYSTVSIGNQVWMGENLKVTKFNNQVPIPLVLDNTQWSTQTQAAYCYYQGDVANASVYGNLYNWYVVNGSKNVCPTGYHVPVIAEWEELITFLGGNAVAGGKLKEIGFTHWLDPNTGADNTSSFTLLPSGWRANNNGVYENMTYMAYLWSSSSVDALISSIVLVGYDSPAAYTSESHILTGLPIRCLKDKTASSKEINKTQPFIVYPNPANDILRIQISDNTSYSIKLVNLTGEILWKDNFENDTFSLDVSNVPNGTYLVEIENKFAKDYIKIVINH